MENLRDCSELFVYREGEVTIGDYEVVEQTCVNAVTEHVHGFVDALCTCLTKILDSL